MRGADPKLFRPWMDLHDLRSVEPTKRLVGGRLGWAIHRFPIKGGKTVGETVVREFHERVAANVTRENQLFNLLQGTRKPAQISTGRTGAPKI